MLRTFTATERTFTGSNGDYVIHPITADVTHNQNGDFYLEIETTLEELQYLNAGDIVAVNIGEDVEAFRIWNIDATLQTVKVKAWHVSYDAENYLIADSYVVDKNCLAALNWLKNACEPSAPFTFTSDITTLGSYRCVRTSLHEAIETVQEKWGGFLTRHNWNIGLHNNVGRETDVEIYYRHNLEDLGRFTEWKDVVTKILPVGKDGLLLNAITASASIYITADTQYDLPFTKTVSFTQDTILEDDYKNSQGNLNETAYKTALVNDLRKQATAYLNEHKTPLVSYTVSSSVDEHLNIGDKVTVKDKNLGINMRTALIGYKYDCVLNEFSEFTFGNFQPTLKDLVPMIKGKK